MSLASGPVVLKVHALASRPNFCGFGLGTCGLEGPRLGVEAKLFCGFGLGTCGLEGPRLGVEAKLLWLWPRDPWP